MKKTIIQKWAFAIIIPGALLAMMISGCSDSDPAGTDTENQSKADAPKVRIMDMTHIADVTATAKAKVSDDGGATLTERGLCWSTSKMPTVEDAHSQTLLKLQGITYWSQLSGLQKGTTYYARAYATNKAGKTGYSDTLRFKAGINWRRAANRSINGLISGYWNPQGYFSTDNGSKQNFQYWPQAHAMDVLVKAYKRTNNDDYLQHIQSLYQGVHAKTGNFINAYYDDMEWNALAMLRAYKATGDEKFKTTVRNMLWPDIKGGWTSVIDGGIMWSKPTPNSKNAVSNGPASIIGATLYQMDQNKEDLRWAKKTFQWEKNHLVDPNSGVVWDNIKLKNDGSRQITKWTFTYNQGTYIGAALKLYHITGEDDYLDIAVKTANNTLDNFTTNGLLPKEGPGDGALFKAVFVRYFAPLIMEEDLPALTRNRYVNFLKANAQTLWNKGTNTINNTFGRFWANKPGETIILKADLSGVALIEAATQLDEKGYFDE